jgi:hypothetical protein
MAEIWDPSSSRWHRGPTMRSRRTGASVSALPDGRVLVAGGGSPTTTSPNGGPLDTVEVFDPRSSGWTPTGKLAQARWRHAGVALGDGRVLVLGGQRDAAPCPGLGSEVWSPRTGAWSAVKPMKRPRCPGAVTVLRDGRVLVAGGDEHLPNVHDRKGLAHVEAWDPTSGEWSELAPLPDLGMWLSKAFSLPDGRVLVTGVVDAGSSIRAVALLSTAAIDAWKVLAPPYDDLAFVAATPDGRVVGLGARPRGLGPGSRDEQVLVSWDPVSDTTALSEPPLLETRQGGLVRLRDGGFLSVGQDGYSQRWIPDGKPVGRWATSGRSFPDRREGMTVSALSTGQVLVTGGRVKWPDSLDSGFLLGEQDGWTAISPLRMARLSHSATVLADGRVLVVGGEDQRRSRPPTLLRWPWRWFDREDPAFLSSSELWDPRTGRWSNAGLMAGRRSSHASALLPDGRVLAIGGDHQLWTGLIAPSPMGRSLATVEVWNPRAGPTSNTWTPIQPMRIPRSAPRAVNLHDGRILVVGGTDSPKPAEVWDPATGAWALVRELVPPAEAGVAVLKSGLVLIVGGSDSVVLDSTRSWDPATRRVVDAGALNIPRAAPDLHVLADGSVLVFGGRYSAGGPCLARAEVWTSASNAWKPTAAMRAPACGSVGLPRPGNQLLVAGSGLPQTWSP